MKSVIMCDTILLSNWLIFVRVTLSFKSTNTKWSGSYWMCVCDIVVGSCLFFLSLSSVIWQTGWLSHMPWERVTKVTLGTGRHIVMYHQVRSLYLFFIPETLTDTEMLLRDHSGGLSKPIQLRTDHITFLIFWQREVSIGPNGGWELSGQPHLFMCQCARSMYLTVLFLSRILKLFGRKWLWIKLILQLHLMNENEWLTVKFRQSEKAPFVLGNDWQDRGMYVTYEFTRLNMQNHCMVL